MDIEIRAITPEEFTAFQETMGIAFSFDPKPEDEERFRHVFEFDRSVAAFDGDQIVGTGGAFSFDLTVPGETTLPMGGTTVITVLPTHRRRGILRRMMRFHLDEVRERGEPLAGLWASESVIYGRFGYGAATFHARAEIERNHAALDLPFPIPGRTRMITTAEALRTYPEVYEKARLVNPGHLSRTPLWWEHERLADPDHWRGGATARRHLIYEEDGEARGYAHFRTKDKREEGQPSNELWISEIIAVDPVARAALWERLLNVDLVKIIKWWNMPVDDPVIDWLANPRRLKRSIGDALWLRVMDVPEVLSGREYAAAGRIVFSLTDEFCPWNEDTYVLEAGPDGAECSRTDDDPEITLRARDLGAVFLGGRGLQAPARAGLVAGDPAALRRADAMFAWHPAPYCPEVF